MPPEPEAVYLVAHWALDRLIVSSCHDSVTGCGDDETAVQVAARVAAAEHLGQAVGDGVVAALALQVPSDAPLVINPSPVRRAGLVPQTVVAPDAVSDIVLEVADGTRHPRSRSPWDASMTRPSILTR